MLNWALKQIELPLKVTWAISRSSCDVKQNFLIEVCEENSVLGRGEVAFNARYGEGPELIETQFDNICQSGILSRKSFQSLEDFSQCLDQFELCSSLRFGLESAFTHYLGTSAKDFLALPPLESGVGTSFSIPILPIEEVGPFFSSWNLGRFPVIKIKVGESDPFGFIQEVARHFSGPLRIDANESFQNVEEYLKFEKRCRVFPVEFMEQPFPAAKRELYRQLRGESSIPLMADESLTNSSVTPEFAELFDGVNVKLMKSGGYLRALSQISEARSMGLKVMLGCMIETTLGISSALQLSPLVDYIDLDGFLFLQEDPFKLVEERDGKLYLSRGKFSD